MTYQQIIEYEMVNQPGPLIDELEKLTGVPYDPAVHGNFYNYVMNVVSRDIYMYTKPKDWLMGFFNNAGQLS